MLEQKHGCHLQWYITDHFSFKKGQECLVTVHCMVNRLELCLKDVCKTLKQHDKVVGTLVMGHYIFTTIAEQSI